MTPLLATLRETQSSPFRSSSSARTLRNGDNTYKAAQKRAQTVFEERLRPLFDRAGFDVDAFRQALAL